MVLNQVHPSRCATSNPSQQGICLGLGTADVVAGRALRRMRPFQIGWKGEAGPSPIPRARSQKAWSMGSSRLKSGKSTRAPCAMATGGQGRPEVCTAHIIFPAKDASKVMRQQFQHDIMRHLTLPSPSDSRNRWQAARRHC